MKRLLFPILSIVVALGVGAYASVGLGRVTASVVFLVITTLALAWALFVIARAAQALVTEPAQSDEARATGRRKKELEREKQALLKALKELEFDFQMGKVSEADYKDIGGNYRARAVRVLKQLDARDGVADYRALVERDLKNRLGAKAGESASDEKAAKADAEKAAAPETPAKPKKEEKGAALDERPVCPKCAVPNDLDAEFCKKCGTRLAAEEVVS